MSSITPGIPRHSLSKQGPHEPLLQEKPEVDLRVLKKSQTDQSNCS
jgi:hypothetical protein